MSQAFAVTLAAIALSEARRRAKPVPHVEQQY